MIKYSFSTLLRYCCSAANSYPILCDLMDSSIPCSSVLHYLMEFAHIHIHWVSDTTYYLILCHPLLFLPLIFSSSRVFSVSWLSWPNYWSFSFNNSPSNEYSGLISFRINWFDFLAVQGTLKCLLQHHHSKASILQCSAPFMVQFTSVYDYLENHSFDYIDLCQLCFLMCYRDSL